MARWPCHWPWRSSCTWSHRAAAENVCRTGWDNPAFDKLWRYNLHYFDDLNAVDADCRHDWHRALILRWIERFPAVLYAGGAVLAWTAAKMIAGEPFMAEALAGQPGWTATIYAGVIGGVLAAAMLRNRRTAPSKNGMETSA